MLKLSNITKDYIYGGDAVNALRGITTEFRKNEFVAVLGPSGCGKTTLLNIIGGLDKYTDGEMSVCGVFTESYTDSDWDAYRNNRIGFVFQNYNLISHLSVAANVELALTLSGVPQAERRRRVSDALDTVGLSAQKNAWPNTLSGGQMQRVAIARAIVNDPDIILADEPTGALDSVSGEQVMALLKELSKTKLVIMVTHNSELAEKFGTRLINMLDGRIVGDTNPYEGGDEQLVLGRENKTAMSMPTALRLSATNLRSKKWRSLVTAIAGSIGIIGIALVFAISGGFSSYIQKMQTDALSMYPLKVSELAVDFNFTGVEIGVDRGEEFPSIQAIYPKKYQSSTGEFLSQNDITDDYITYVKDIDRALISGIAFDYAVDVRVVRGNERQAVKVNSKFGLLPGDADMVRAQFDIVAGSFPAAFSSKDIFLVVDSYNSLDADILNDMGFTTKEPVAFEDMLAVSMKAVSNDDCFVKTETGYAEKNSYTDMYNSSSSIPLGITAILRVKQNTDFAFMDSGFYYTEPLIDELVSLNSKSEIVESQKQAGSSSDVLNAGKPFTYYNIGSYQDMYDIAAAIVFDGTARFPLSPEQAYEFALQGLGANKTVRKITVYPKTFEAKESIKAYLDGFTGEVKYTDEAEILTNMMGDVVSTISIVLICFAAVSLLVSSIMIGVITYVSVVERTREIGILRSIGARKRDIARVFNAETIMLGLVSGILGIVMTYIISLPLNVILAKVIPVANLASLNVLTAICLVAVSALLTFISGLFPALLAAKKDPVAALRSD